MDKPEKSMDSEGRRIRATAFWLAIFAVTAAAIIFAFAIYVIAVQFIYWQEVLKEHFGAIIGLPGAAAVAFAIVVFLRQTEGPIEFEGAAGQVVMWIANCHCYKVDVVSLDKDFCDSYVGRCSALSGTGSSL